MLQPDGPLRGLGLVAEASDDGSFSDPQLSFTTDDTLATAIVGLGDDVPEDATLTVAWYRLVGVDGREHLFSHEIPIGPGGHAFSQGMAEGGLAPGLYETVATLGDRQVRTPWVVRLASESDGALSSVSGGAFALLSFGSVAQQEEEPFEPWNVPDSGDSGWYDPETTPASPPPPGPCEVDQIFPGFNPLTTVDASVSWVGRCSRMTLAAAVSGPPQEIASREISQGSLPFLNGQAEVCELPGGSDLPGTVVRWSATGSEGAMGSMGSNSLTLPDFGGTLEAKVQAADGTPSRVDPGYRIELRGMAMVMPPALGIEELSLYAGDELIRKVGNLSETSEPQPCDFGRYAALNRASYTVPGDPPPIIEICAEAIGFDGTESRECIEFYTGEVWKGTVTGVSIEHAAPCRYPFNGEVTIVVAGDGEATLSATSTSSGTCRGVFASKSAPFEVSGTRTPTGFQFPGPFPGMGPLAIATTGNHGSGRTTGFVGPTFEVTLDFDVECTSCG